MPIAPWTLSDRVFDVIVYGTGYAGYAATMALRRDGRSVLLIGARGDLVWESGRSFCPVAGDGDHPVWRRLGDDVAGRGGATTTWIDGAIAEIVATGHLLTSGASVLYYARPVAAERSGDALSGMVVATRSGLRRVLARQWIDASETGEVLRLLDPAHPLRPPSRSRAYLMLQHAGWPEPAAAGLGPTVWPTERVLELDVEPGDPWWRRRVLTGLAGLETDLGPEIAHVSMSHLSIEPALEYAAGGNSAPTAPNVVSAAPAATTGSVSTLADRFELGIRAAASLLDRAWHEPADDARSRPLPSITPTRTVRADVCVAGTGTGGALAAIAAAQAGANVSCIEPLAFAGGIGTGGGIHLYCYGVAGGLQQWVDRRTRALMKRFRGGPLGDGPFNPWAKMIALDQLLEEHRVDLHRSAALFDVETEGDRVTAAMVATPNGVVRVEAASFVDGTGDGDLCAVAGAGFTYGRAQDGMAQAFSQSSGRLTSGTGRPRMAVVNFDAGFCHATDPQDLTRARLSGIHQYLIARYDNESRPTYIAPALGIRQSRQVVTDYMLTLDDQIRRRRFDDAIGYTRSFCDNHATDYEFESDEAVFWVWANRQFRVPVGCETSYRMLLPRGLANVWIASRCLGLSRDAHYATRMQRDMQRVGEAAGFAAAEAARRGQASRELPYEVLRTWLDRTGALDRKPAALTSDFGTPGDFPEDELETSGTGRAAEALAALDRGESGAPVWWLYRHEAAVRDAVLQRLATDDPGMTGWLAAGIVAMWGRPAAEPRLIRAIDTAEYGFDDQEPAGQRFAATPLTWSKAVPNWLCAIALLRRCGTAACLPALDRLLDRPVHGVNTLTTVAVTLGGLARRGELADDAPGVAAKILDRVLTATIVGSLDYAARDVGRYSELAMRGATTVPRGSKPILIPPGSPEQVRNAHQDNRWQLQFAVAHARAALGLRMQESARAGLRDERAPVRGPLAALATLSDAQKGDAR